MPIGFNQSGFIRSDKLLLPGVLERLLQQLTSKGLRRLDPPQVLARQGRLYLAMPRDPFDRVFKRYRRHGRTVLCGSRQGIFDHGVIDKRAHAIVNKDQIDLWPQLLQPTPHRCLTLVATRHHTLHLAKAIALNYPLSAVRLLLRRGNHPHLVHSGTRLEHLQCTG